MKATMPCLPGRTLAHLIATSVQRVYRCSILLYLSHIALHTTCILIVLQRPSEENTLGHIPKALLKNSSYGSDDDIDGPVP